MATLRLPLDREPNPQAATVSAHAAQLELWRAQAMRDCSLISDREMEKMEGAVGMNATRARVLWNPFTGEFVKKEIANCYKSGDYITMDNEGLTRLIQGNN